MSETYKSSGHCVGESNWHFKFTPAYRQDIFADGLVRELTVAYLLEAAHELNVKISAIECGPDHIHMFLQETRKVSVVEAVHKLKGYSSRMMRKRHYALFRHKLWGKKFWSGGYFFQTVGMVTAESVKEYIEKGQRKHWETDGRNQKTLFNYSG